MSTTDQARQRLRAALEQIGSGGQGADVSAHGVRVFSDERLKEAVAQAEPEVEAHTRGIYSDERLEQAVEQTESALTLLDRIDAERRDG